jgi:hypothetical protein
MNRYEIVIKVGDEQVTRIKHAESPGDAVYFAAANMGLEHPNTPMRILHVGPPAEDIDRYEAVLAKVISDKTASLFGEKED